MAFMDDLKTNQRTQILCAGILFFIISFPIYFNYAANNVEDYEVTGPTYEVEGTLTFIEIGNGTQIIGNQAIATVSVSSTDLDDENIVGFRIKISHSDTESPCDPTGTATPQDDEVSAEGGINGETTNFSGTDAELESSHYWINTSIINTSVPDVLEADIHGMLTGGEVGQGDYTFNISVDVNAGSANIGPFDTCQNQDSGEEVDWVIELILLEYTVEMVDKRDLQDDDSEGDDSDDDDSDDDDSDDDDSE